MSWDRVPEELRERDQWLLWSADSDPPKRPLNADGYGASWNDPSELLAFDEAVGLAGDDEFDGIGYVIMEGDPYVGLDLDGCLREPFQEKPKDWLPSLEDLRGTYIEYSQSGTGLHPFVRDAQLPDWWADSHFTDDEHEGVEAYESKFFIVTGEPVEELSGPTIQAVEIAPFLAEAYEVINGEAPRLPGADDRPAADTDAEVGIYDVITRSSYPEGKNIEHPFHPSSTGTNFRVDPGGETFRCWRHDVTGNGHHLLGIEQGVISCGDWVPGGLETETWREIYDAARDAGYDIPAPETRPNGGTAAADGGAEAAFQTGAELSGASADAQLKPGAIIGRAGYDPDEDSLADLKASEAAFAIDRILQDHDGWHFLVVDDDSEDIYTFHGDDGIWRRDGERRLKQICRQAMNTENSKTVHSETVYTIEGNPNYTVQRSELGGPGGKVVTPDGLLDLLTHDLEPVRPRHRALNRIEARYDSEADYEGTRWEQFLEESVDPVDLDKLQEYAGYCLWHNAQPFGKACFLVGPTNSGKGTFLKAITGVIGLDNVANETLYDLINSRWGAAQLFGRMVNIRNEVSPGDLKRVEKFKELTGGEDTLSAEYKGQDKFKFQVTQKFLFATNQMPDISEPDGAFLNRCLFVSFPNTVADEDQDKELLDRLADEQSVILSWMLEGLGRLMHEGVFSGERSAEDKELMLQEHGDSTDRFLHSVLEVTGDKDDLVSKPELYQLYTRFCDWAGREPEVQQTFTTDLKSHDKITDGQSRRLTSGDSRDHVYKGVRVSERACNELQHDVPKHSYAGDDGGGGSQQSLR